MKKIFILSIFLIPFFLSSLTAGRKVYWHFYIHCYKVDREEHLWLTMVEVERKKAFPEEARMIEAMGGEMGGIWLGFLRGAAFRETDSRKEPVCCRKGVFGGCVTKGFKKISWKESWADRAYAIGEIRTSENKREFKISAMPRRVLRPNGSWLTVGPAVLMDPVSGESKMITQNRVIYNDPYMELEKCGKKKYKLYKSIFSRNWKIKGTFKDIGQLQYSSYRTDKYVCDYSLLRSHSARHPVWRQR